MTNVYFDKLEDYRDIESIQYYTELTDSGLMNPDYMMKCLMLRSRDNARTHAVNGFTSRPDLPRVSPGLR